MSLRLDSEEPEGGPWRAEPLTAVIDAVIKVAAGRSTSGGVVLALDGRSSSGKTALAARLNQAVASSAVVHTDDIAWWHSRFGWADLLIDGILVPFRRGEPVSFRPPRWTEQPGGPRTIGDYRAWMAEEESFLAGERPWDRADLLVAGTPQIPFDPGSELVVAPPLYQ